MRLAQRGDEPRLRDILVTAYRENGFGRMDDAAVRDVAAKGCRGESYVFGLIDGPDRIEAVLGLQPSRMWYGGERDWYWTELLFYVHPQHRRSRHAQTLFAFADWWERHARVPVVIGVFPTERLEAKEFLFARHALRVGSLWLIGTGEFRDDGGAA